MERVRKFLKKLFYIVEKPYMRVLPGQLAFFTVLSLIPLVAALGMIASCFSIPVSSFSSVISKILPADITGLATTGISGKGLTFNLIVFFLTSFFLASNGAHSIIITSNEIYGIEGRGFFGRRLKAIIITIIIVLLIMFILTVPVFGNNIFDAIKDEIGDGKTLEFLSYLFKIIRIPITMLLMFFVVKIIYHMAPDKKISIKDSNLGPIFTTVMWIIGTEIYSIYVRNFTNYNLFYGSISNILILMIWVYFLSYIFVFGMAINATEDEKQENMNRE